MQVQHYPFVDASCIKLQLTKEPVKQQLPNYIRENKNVTCHNSCIQIENTTIPKAEKNSQSKVN